MVLIGRMSGQVSSDFFVGRFNVRSNFAVEERPQDPLSHPCRDGSQARVSEAFLNCSQEGAGLYQNS